MHILFVESYPHVMYGQQRTLLYLLEVACQEGHTVQVLSTERGVFADHVESMGQSVICCGYPERLSQYGGAIYRYGFRDKLLTQWQAFSYIKTLRDFLLNQEEHIDIVFCNDMRGLLTMGVAARLCGIPAVIWDKLDKPHGVLDWFQLPIADLNIIISDAVLKKYPAWQKRWYKRKIHKIHDGCAKLDGSGGDVRKYWGIEPSDVLLTMVGSITPRKGQDRLLRILPELITSCPNIKVLLVGEADDTATKYCQTLPNIDHPSVIRTGYIDNIAPIMSSIDVLLLLSRQEGLGLVAVEAMSAGKPVVGTRTGGIPEVVIDGETGLLVEGGDDAALLEALTTLCHDPRLRERMGQAGRVRAETHFDRHRQHRRVVELMCSLVESR
ncbi:glycosyltransferase family 4 protein [Billgrantia kenyensis]|uniref:Glycosyltransferase family 4 protein n=1 Tax=Billgrantia kenyensis TaxID=321266 RepID=A0A7V9W3F3_9GAMM|nr:glycosyltransferase family 4 protein [Halomonas kenyensis]MBA2780245.1 glycosyltransferase family 4 protein [Halomonas kenyensis]MCG6663099.1 glycosyltransferase family 4 protein [Halomonas kenyensis]